MQGVILAAGQGTRMGNLEIPKCLLKIDDITLIEYQLTCLKKLGIDDILIVTGYNDQMIKQHLGSKVKYAFNKNFENTNNLHSLSKAKDFVTNDFICLHADLLFHPDILRKCVEHKSMICLAVERNTRDETMRVEIDQKNILQINKTIPFEDSHGNFIGMVKFHKEIVESLFDNISELIKKNNSNAYFVLAIEKMIKKGHKVEFIETKNLPWIDIDEKNELESAKKIFSSLGN